MAHSFFLTLAAPILKTACIALTLGKEFKHKWLDDATLRTLPLRRRILRLGRMLVSRHVFAVRLKPFQILWSVVVLSTTDVPNRLV